MKKTTIFLTLLATLSCCSKDDNNETLPPATQTGAGTFACHVNGHAFIDTSGGYFNCYYQLIDGEYFFGIQGRDDVGDLTSITLGTEKKEINEGNTYSLLKILDGNMWGGEVFQVRIIHINLFLPILNTQENSPLPNLI